MTRRRPAGEEGTVLVLLLGLFAVLLVLVAVVVDVSAVALDKRALASAADGAAVSGAQALDLDVFYADGPGAGVPLSEAGVAERVAAYGQGAAVAQPGLTMASRVEGGYTAVVTASRTVQLPFSGWLGVSAVELSATARARAPLLTP